MSGKNGERDGTTAKGGRADSGYQLLFITPCSPPIAEFTPQPPRPEGPLFNSHGRQAVENDTP